MADYESMLPTMEAHTKVKHEILRKYLEKWFPILGQYNKSLVFIDGFAGPGRYQSGDSGSPLIALDTAINHSSNLTSNISFLFIEKRQDRFNNLKEEISRLNLPPNLKPFPKNGCFNEIMTKFFQHEPNFPPTTNPTFAFIDPSGFKGLPFSIITNILQRESYEVFITFTRRDINRFLEKQDLYDEFINYYSAH